MPSLELLQYRVFMQGCTQHCPVFCENFNTVVVLYACACVRPIQEPAKCFGLIRCDKTAGKTDLGGRQFAGCAARHCGSGRDLCKAGIVLGNKKGAKGLIAQFLPDMTQAGLSAVRAVAAGVENPKGSQGKGGDVFLLNVFSQFDTGFRTGSERAGPEKPYNNIVSTKCGSETQVVDKGLGA